MAGITLIESKLCVADMEDFEEVTGVPLLECLDGARGNEWKPAPKILAGIIWISKRMEDPDFTYDQARREPISQLTIDGRANPTVAAPKKSAPKKSASKRPSTTKKSASKR